MHGLVLPFLLIAIGLSAQPRPELSVVFVHDAHGRPMPGAYAAPIAAQAWLGKPKAPAWTVEMHFTVSQNYAYSVHEIGTHKSWPLAPTTLRDRRTEHLQFHILDCFCIDRYLLVIQAEDTMRIDVPDDPTLRGHLVHRIVARSGALPSPEVVRFRPGRFRFEQLEGDAFNELEQRLARQVVAADAARQRAKRTRKQAKGQ